MITAFRLVHSGGEHGIMISTALGVAHRDFTPTEWISAGAGARLSLRLGRRWRKGRHVEEGQK